MAARRIWSTPCLIQAMLALCLGLLGAVASARAETIRVGVAAELFPPFIDIDEGGQLDGWEIRFMQAVCAEAALECVTHHIPFGGLIDGLLVGEIDVIASSMSITRERAEVIAFSDPYYRALPLVAAPKGATVHLDGTGMRGLRLGVMRGTTHHAYAERYFANAGAKIVAFPDQLALNQALASGDVDAVQSDSAAMVKFVRTDEGQCCEIKGAVPNDPLLGSGVGLGLRQSDEALRARFNAAIAAVIANGTRDAITRLYFNVPIY